MKRLPDANRADERLSGGRLTAAHLERVAERLARFHRDCGFSEEAAGYGAVTAIRFNLQENFDQTMATISDYLSGEQVRKLESWQLRFLEERSSLFEERMRSDRVRDGHGDLRLEHLYLDDRGAVEIVDCIEFNERFRFADVCADVVFLAMDLAWHGRVDLAERFLAYYAREADDYDLYPLVDFYESYRAFVRGKIASMVATDEAMSQMARERAREEARRYYRLALASERRPLLPPTVIAVGGVIASGKSRRHPPNPGSPPPQNHATKSSSRICRAPPLSDTPQASTSRVSRTGENIASPPLRRRHSFCPRKALVEIPKTFDRGDISFESRSTNV